MDDSPVRSTHMPRGRERDLVARSRGDAAAFGALYDFYLPRIYGFIYRRVGERAVAEDLTATTFQRALEAIRANRFRNEAFGGWLYRVAHNALIDHVRRRSRTVSLDQTDDPSHRRVGLTADLAFEAFAAALDRDELRIAMASLSETHRRVLLLRYFDDLELDEVCAVLGCSRRTFAVKLHRALNALRSALQTDVTVPLTETTDAA
jgi:RNA polymerase sigma-70 factor, ECF subfamily